MSVNLVTLYEVEKKSIKDIAIILNMSYNKTRNLLIENGVKMRTKIEGYWLAQDKILKSRIGRTFTISRDGRKRMSEAALKRWKDKSVGYSKKPNGYIEITIGENKGRLQHVVKMESHIGRSLNKNEVVHHINDIKDDNRIENLQLMTRRNHCSLHAKKNYKLRNKNKKGQFV